MQVESKIIDIKQDKNTILSNEFIESELNIAPDKLLRWAVVDINESDLKISVAYIKE